MTTPVGKASDYKEITIISGKGGTGKTTVVASLAVLAENKILADNDVDAADLHLLLAPVTVEGVDFYGGSKAVIHTDQCIACGKCAAACHFDSIREDGPQNNRGATTFRVDPLACEACGLCALVCPVNAIESIPTVVGRCYVSQTDRGPMAHAKLGIAEDNSGRLVTQVRNRAAELAREFGQELILGDGPPGTGCPVIASVSGADLILVVTEPTVSGVHDMDRVLQLTAHFGIQARVIINKADLNLEQAARIEKIAGDAGMPVIARIPFDSNVHDALMAGRTVVEYGKGPAAEAMHNVWRILKQELQEMNS
ncbi:MAG: ATP-binding protein [Lentisphaeria bacterium]|nr:ATP-binding protein [Lentisphaeria bacterium]